MIFAYTGQPMFAPGERVSRDEGPARRSPLLLHRTGHEELCTYPEGVLGKDGLIEIIC